MSVRSFLSAVVFAALAVGISPASASVLFVDSYDMLNGTGKATGAGSLYNYWDGTYTPGLPGNQVTTDSAPLSGGKGALTNGVIATGNWNFETNIGGTGLYVGWLNQSDRGQPVPDPLITFHLSSLSTVKELDMYVDNSGNGFVGAPPVLIINGVSYVPTATWLTPPPAGAPDECTFNVVGGVGHCAEKLTVTGLDLTGGLITVQAPHSLPFVFISEVEFQGVAGGVPELPIWCMMLIGFAGLGYLAYRRKNRLGLATA